jgi:hypothetical protein
LEAVLELDEGFDEARGHLDRIREGEGRTAIE